MDAFSAAYDRVLGQWPVPVEVADLTSAYGSTRVISCGPPDAPALVLLPGGGATSTVWFATVAALSRQARVHAVDLPGDAGHTVATGQSIQDIGDLHGWLAGVLDAVGGVADLAGHSYGGWIALTYALRSPERVRRLALLDPTRCFAGFAPGYLLHAVPTLLRPTAGRTAALLRWETGGRALDPAWAELAGLAAERPSTGKLVVGPKPDAAQIRRLDVPTLVLLGGSSRAHDIDRVGAAARRLLPRGTVAVIPGASHHSLPIDPATPVNEALTAFFTP